jgi:hypothetical protein
MALTLEQIIAAEDIGTEEIEMPEWGGTVKIRGLGYGEWVDIRSAATIGGEQDERVFVRLMFAGALVDPVVTPEQADLLGAKSANAVNRLVMRIMEISHITDDAVKEAEARFPG